jgi:carboxyl-terminal processing protease
MKLNRTSKWIISLSFLAWFGIGFFLLNGTALAETRPSENVYQKLRLFNDVLFKLRENYVDDVDMEKLVDDAIKGMLSELDPHTTYFTPDEFEKFSTDTKGEFGGLGISIDKIGNYITVVSPIEGTPAYQMGILAGDKIIKVDGVSVIGIDTTESIKLMRGEPGTKVIITIRRPGIEHDLDFEIVRDIIKIESIPYSFKMGNGIGYIRIRQFNANTTEELRTKLNQLETEGIRGLLIDLRFNPGGLLNEAVYTVNEFIGPNKRVVFTKGRTADANREYFTRFNNFRNDYPIVVLINEASASASEIFAGSMQDYDRALVVGKTSFGKGSVQRLFPLSDGNGIKITTAKYYINSGRCIHKDVNDVLFKDQRLRSGEMSIEEIEDLRDKADKEHYKDIYYTQKGRVVYGGGGINPDVVLEQSILTKLEIEIRRRNLIFNYAIDYMVINEQSVKLGFETDDKMLNDFFEYCRKDGLEFTEEEADSAKKWVKNSLTSNIISKKFGSIESYKISIRDDTQLQEAISILETYPTLAEMFAFAEEKKSF